MGSESLFSQACLAGVANRFLRRNNFDKKKTSTQKTNKNNSAWKTKHISLKLIKTHRTNILCQTSGGFDVIMTSSHTTDTSSEVISSTINSVFIPWDNPENVMSHETYVKFTSFLCCLSWGQEATYWTALCSGCRVWRSAWTCVCSAWPWQTSCTSSFTPSWCPTVSLRNWLQASSMCSITSGMLGGK